LKSFLDASKQTRSTMNRFVPMGDPIDDPKPNNAKH
jgi:hypothetical protein